MLREHECVVEEIPWALWAVWVCMSAQQLVVD